MGFVGLDPATNAFAPDKLREEAIRSRAIENAAVDTAQGHLGAADIMALAREEIPARAGGGLAQARRPYLVGEKGPELIVPKADGTVIPNHKISKLLMLLQKKKAVVPRAAGGDVEAGGAPDPALENWKAVQASLGSAARGVATVAAAPVNLIDRGAQNLVGLATGAIRQTIPGTYKTLPPATAENPMGLPLDPNRTVAATGFGGGSAPAATAPPAHAAAPVTAPVAPVTAPVAVAPRAPAPAAPIAAAVPVPVAPVAPAPATIAPGAADLAAAAAIRPPGFTPIRTSEGGGMTLGTNDLGVQEIRTSHPSWQLYQGAGRGVDYPGAVAAWRKEQDAHAEDLTKAGLTAESHLEAARITKPYQHTEEGAKFLANAELKSPKSVAEAETLRATEAARVGETHVATLNNYLANTYPAFNKETGKTAFKAPDEGVSSDALAATEVAKRQGAPAAVTHFQERQAVRKYLQALPESQVPRGTNINGYITSATQDPATWSYLVKQALPRLTPAAPATQSLTTVATQPVPAAPGSMGNTF